MTSPHRALPFWSLTPANIRCCLLRLFAQSRSTVRVLLADALPVWEILGPVNDEDERADVRAVDAHVGEDARGVHPVERVRFAFGRHCDGCEVLVCWHRLAGIRSRFRIELGVEFVVYAAALVC